MAFTKKTNRAVLSPLAQRWTNEKQKVKTDLLALGVVVLRSASDEGKEKRERFYGFALFFIAETNDSALAPLF